MARRSNDEAPPAEATAPAADTKTPDEWATLLGRVVISPQPGKLPPIVQPCWQHSAASALHGWEKHAHHAGAPIQLTQAAYEAALAAAESAPYTPHPGALSPHNRG